MAMMVMLLMIQQDVSCHTVFTQIKVVFSIRLGPPVILITTFLVFFSPNLYSNKSSWVGSHDNTFIGLQRLVPIPGNRPENFKNSATTAVVLMILAY